MLAIHKHGDLAVLLVNALSGLRTGIGAKQINLLSASTGRYDHAFAESEGHLSRREVGDNDDQSADQVFQFVGALDPREYGPLVFTAKRQRQLDQLFGLGHLFGVYHAGHAQVDFRKVIDRD